MGAWNNIIVHHSASGWGNALFIDRWHKSRGWLGIGYHFVILNGFTNSEDLKKSRRLPGVIGSVECGRTLDGDQWVEGEEIGAHALGFNRDSIGICLIHKEQPYHPAMIASLLGLTACLMDRYSISTENVLGHYEVSEQKPLCPGLDMDKIRGFLR